MLSGRRYRLALNTEQIGYAESVVSVCRAVWNAALEQRRAAAQLNWQRTEDRAVWPNFESQCRELTEAKQTESWLTDAPAKALQQTLRDLDRGCRTNGVWHVRWRSKKRSRSSFRFPADFGTVRRLSKRWADVRLPRIGVVRFRWTRDLGGTVRNVTVQRECRRWYVSFCVEDGQGEAQPNGLPPVGVDRGVVVAAATSDGELLNRVSSTPGEALHVRRLQKRLSRQKGGSQRRRRTVLALGRAGQRLADRRRDFTHQTAQRLTTTHGMVVIEALRVAAMTRSASGTVDEPGRNVRAKAGLNRAIRDKGWGFLRLDLEWHGRKNGCSIVAVPPAYTSQTCSACGYRAAASRESQARFCCQSCGFVEHADINAAKVILAAGLAVTARGDFGDARSMKREPTDLIGTPEPTGRGGSQSTVTVYAALYVGGEFGDSIDAFIARLAG